MRPVVPELVVVGDEPVRPVGEHRPHAGTALAAGIGVVAVLHPPGAPVLEQGIRPRGVPREGRVEPERGITVGGVAGDPRQVRTCAREEAGVGLVEAILRVRVDVVAGRGEDPQRRFADGQLRGQRPRPAPRLERRGVRAERLGDADVDPVPGVGRQAVDGHMRVEEAVTRGPPRDLLLRLHREPVQGNALSAGVTRRLIERRDRQLGLDGVRLLAVEHRSDPRGASGYGVRRPSARPSRPARCRNRRGRPAPAGEPAWGPDGPTSRARCP